jgi:hypothetical protein
MTLSFVDPRSDPDPESPRPAPRFAANPEELDALLRYCDGGRLYDVERWIQAGKPLQLSLAPTGHRPGRYRSALEIALDRQDHSLVMLLLANGFDLASEPGSPLDSTLRSRRRDLLDLLLAWGADPRRMNLEALCDTYDSELYERFRRRGVDLSAGHALAYALGEHTSNKPLFGFAKRHRLSDPGIQADLDIALAQHAKEGNEKGVLLCLWAGADPHAPAPWLDYLGTLHEETEDDDEGTSAISQACWHGHAGILEHLKPDPERDDFDELYRAAADESVVAVLLRSAPPRHASEIVRRQVMRLNWPLRRDRPIQALESLFGAGMRWHSAARDDLAAVRRDLLKVADPHFIGLMKLLGTADHCSQEVLSELARTPAMRKRMKGVGLIPSTPQDRSAFDWARPRRARELLARFGIVQATPKKRETKPGIPRTVAIGRRDTRGDVLRLDRPQLFERVWSTPVDILAKTWGLSGRGLAKACHRLRVPVPPRGYWAKIEAGQTVRRPRLPRLPQGQADVVLIHLPEEPTDPRN